MRKFKYHYVCSFILLTALLIQGCSINSMPPANPLGDTSYAQLVAQIVMKYPELQDRPYEVDTVARTIDGDTMQLRSGHKVRLIGVDTPESVKNVEFFGKEASKFTRLHLTGKTVILFQDVGNTDKYGRLLRYVFIEGEPTMYNEQLIREGYANTMTIPPNVMYSEKFFMLERNARKQSKGLWKASSQEHEVGADCSSPTIKGNINSKAEKIYHMPNSRHYKATIAEEMFCTEQDAQREGYRKAKN